MTQNESRMILIKHLNRLIILLLTLLICLAWGEAKYYPTEGETNFYKKGYKVAQSNFAPIIEELTLQVGKLQTSYSNEVRVYEATIAEKDRHFTNQMDNFSNFHSNFVLYTEAKLAKRKSRELVIVAVASSVATALLGYLVANIEVKGSLLSIQF